MRRWISCRAVSKIRVLLTGERGFLGSRVRDLLDADPAIELEVLGKRLGELAAGELPDFDVVVHLAGWKYAGVSVDRPLHFYRQNVTGMQTLLEAMTQREIDAIVFSSSSACFHVFSLRNA